VNLTRSHKPHYSASYCVLLRQTLAQHSLLYHITSQFRHIASHHVTIQQITSHHPRCISLTSPSMHLTHITSPSMHLTHITSPSMHLIHITSPSMHLTRITQVEPARFASRFEIVELIPSELRAPKAALISGSRFWEVIGWVIIAPVDISLGRGTDIFCKCDGAAERLSLITSFRFRVMKCAIPNTLFLCHTPQLSIVFLDSNRVSLQCVFVRLEWELQSELGKIPSQPKI
jgi:hypothetical protein